MRQTILILIAILFTICQLKVNAGGPLVVKGSMAITYGTRPFLYRYDKGSLGMFTNSEAVALIQSLFSEWDAIKTSQINFMQDTPGLLDFDVTSSNFGPILNSSDLLGYTAVIFDTDGTVLDEFLGSGAGNSVLGLSGPVTVNSGPLVNQIAESQAIFNGKFVNGTDTPSDPESSVDSFRGTIIHETGHGIGLDHSQINVEAIKPGATQEIRDSVPLEFPVAVNDLYIIRQDDASSVSLLYPNQAELGKYGRIEGKVFRQNGTTPVLGANVIARNVNDPKLEAISCVSDYLADNTGSYTLFAVPPGDYTIEIEPIDLSFTGGSGVGPYTQSTTDKSFQNPVPEGFYTGPNLPITTDETQALKVSVLAGQVVKDANIVAAPTLVSSSSTSGSVAIEELEPNDTPSTAQVITPPVTISGMASSSDSGKVELTTDTGAMVTIVDLFKFTLTQPSSVNALLTIESDLAESDLDLALLDEIANKLLDASGQSGNVDELISKSLQAGTYLLGIGAFSGSTAYMLQVSVSPNVGPPALNITGQDTLLLQPIGMNKLTLTAAATNFTSRVKCSVSASDDTLVMIKPRKFSLSPGKTEQKIRVKVPLSVALDLIASDLSETATISITCGNGTGDEVDILIEPFSEDIVGSRK